MGFLKSPLTAFVLIAIAAFAAYAGVLQYEFVNWDDPTLITQNPFVATFSGKIFTTFDPELYIPLTLLTFQMEHALAGFNPVIFHLDNLLLHIANAFLVYLFFYTRTNPPSPRDGRGYGGAGNRALAVLGALIFAVHPLNVETVAWVSARKESLMAFFFLGSLLTALRSNRMGDRWYLSSIGLFLCALLAKATAVMLPVVLIFLDLRDGDSFGESLKKRWPWLMFAIIFGIVALFGKQGVQTLDPFSFSILAVQSVAFYIQKLMFPMGLSAIYSAPPLTIASSGFIIACVMIIVIASIGWIFRKKKDVLFGLFFFAITLAPSLLAYTKANEITLAADRYAYLPSIGWIFFLGSLVVLLRSDLLRKVAASIALAIVIIFVPLARTQANVWRDTQSLFLHVLAVDPTSAIAKNNLGFLLIGRGELDDALIFINEAIAKNPQYVDALVNRAVIFGKKRMLAEAEADLRRALVIDPNAAQAHFNLGGVHFVQGKWSAAEAEYRETLRINPYHEDARRQLEATQKKAGAM